MYMQEKEELEEFVKKRREKVHTNSFKKVLLFLSKYGITIAPHYYGVQDTPRIKLQCTLWQKRTL